VSLHQLQSSGIRLRPHEAVAVIQQLIHRTDWSRPAGGVPPGPPASENIEICASGDVLCHGCSVTPSVAELAIVLQSLLAVTAPVPGGLQYAIGRALHDVEAPPFDSLADFSQTLARHERGAREAVVRGLHARVAGVVPRDRRLSGLTVVAPAPHRDRRAHPPLLTDLRRSLREADLRLFEQLRTATPNAQNGHGSGRLLSILQMRRSWSRRAPVFAGAGLAVLLAAAGALSWSGRRDTTLPGKPTTSAVSVMADAPRVASSPRRPQTPVAPTRVSRRRRPPAHAAPHKLASSTRATSPRHRGFLRIRFVNDFH
jgi:hypothetical protein